MDIFYFWVPDINLKLSSVVIAMDLVELTSEDDMFMAKITTSLGRALPDAIPGGIRSYGDFASLGPMSSSCKVLRDCADPMPSHPQHSTIHSSYPPKLPPLP